MDDAAPLVSSTTECAWCFERSVETATITLTGGEPAELDLCARHIGELLRGAERLRGL